MESFHPRLTELTSRTAAVLHHIGEFAMIIGVAALGGATVANAQAVSTQGTLAAQLQLERIVRNGHGAGNDLVPDPLPITRLTVPAAWRTAALRTAASLVGRVEINEFGAWVEQPDSGGHHPFAAAGDTLTVVAMIDRVKLTPLTTLHTMPVRVMARRRFKANLGGCGLVDHDGWAYLTAPLTSAGPRTIDQWITWQMGLVLPGAVQLTQLQTASPAARAVLAPRYRALLQRSYQRLLPDAKNYGLTPAQLRQTIFGDDGTGGWLTSPVKQFRGPSGPLVVALMTVNDDPSDHGGNTQRTVVATPQGQVIADFPSGSSFVATMDLDGDGVDEILLADGVLAWDGQYWQRLIGWPSTGAC